MLSSTEQYTVSVDAVPLCIICLTFILRVDKDQITRNIMPALPSSPASPPLHVLTYAIRNIMFPTLLTRQIRDILVLLANVECVRKKLASSIENVLIWDDHYKDEKYRDSDTYLLDEDERDTVAALQKDLCEKMPHAYCKILAKFMQLVSVHLTEVQYTRDKLDSFAHRTFTRRGYHQISQTSKS